MTEEEKRIRVSFDAAERNECTHVVVDRDALAWALNQLEAGREALAALRRFQAVLADIAMFDTHTSAAHVRMRVAAVEARARTSIAKFESAAVEGGGGNA